MEQRFITNLRKTSKINIFKLGDCSFKVLIFE